MSLLRKRLNKPSKQQKDKDARKLALLCLNSIAKQLKGSGISIREEAFWTELARVTSSSNPSSDEIDSLLSQAKAVINDIDARISGQKIDRVKSVFDKI